MMRPGYIKFIKWLLSFGKVKGSAFMFLILTTALTALSVIYNILTDVWNHETFSNILQFDNHNLVFSVIFSFIISLNFYNRAATHLKLYQQLTDKGLTLKDINRNYFIADWNKKRELGIVKYVLYSGGLIGGLILLLPISVGILFYLKNSGGLSSDYTNMAVVILFGLIIGYAIGAITYSIRWLINERKLNRLTNPLL